MSTTIAMTINLPQELVTAAQELVRLGKVKNFEEFIKEAIENEISKNNLSLTSSDDPILGLGENPVYSGITDASVHLDNYIYK